jgi:hypothetical protein
MQRLLRLPGLHRSPRARSSQKANGHRPNSKNPVPPKIILPRSPIRQLYAEHADAPIVLDETCIKPWGKLRLLTL